MLRGVHPFARAIAGKNAALTMVVIELKTRREATLSISSTKMMKMAAKASQTLKRASLRVAVAVKVTTAWCMVEAEQ